MITSHDLDKFGKQAAKAYLTSNTPLNDTIEKQASTHGLNSHQIARVVESANTNTYLSMIKTAEDNYVDFPLADAKEIHKTVVSHVEKTASLDDYDAAPTRFMDTPEPEMEKTAENSSRTLSEIEKDAARLEGTHAFLIDESHKVRTNFINTYDKVWSMSKQALLQGTPFIDIIKIASEAAPNFTDFIEEDFSEYSKETLPTIDLTKEAEHSGIVNPKSDLYMACEELEKYAERYNKIIDAAIAYEDKYEVLEKEAAGIGSGIKNIAVGAGQTMGGIVGQALKVLSKPKLVLGGLGIGLAYWGGKAKGRKDQGEILQKQMLAPKYRKAMY